MSGNGATVRAEFVGFADIFSTELRRQNAPSANLWLKRVMAELCEETANTRTSSPTSSTRNTDEDNTNSPDSAVGGGPRSSCSRDGELIIVNLHRCGMEDRVAMALFEALVKMKAANTSSPPRTCVLDLTQNALSDQSLRHVELAALVCPLLRGVLLANNTFSQDGIERLQRALRGACCPCIISVDAATTAAVAAAPSCASASASLATSSVSQRHCRATSMSTHTSTKTPNKHVGFFAANHGSAEALQARREALLRGAAPQTTSPQTIDLSPEPQTTRESPVRARNNTNTTTTTNNNTKSAQQRTYDVRTSSEPITTPHTSTVMEPTPTRSFAPPPPLSATSKTSSPRVAQHDDDGDDDDGFNLTTNLNPLLDSVLNLSRMTDKNGVVRTSQQHVRDDDDVEVPSSVWEMVEAYEMAVEQFSARNDVDERILARLPASVHPPHHFNVLTVLSLSHNFLRELHHLPSTLLRLDLSHNMLTNISGLDDCRMLAVLNLRHNAISSMRGLERCVCVAHLFLGHNQIHVIDGIAHLLLLETLDVSHNRLRTTSSMRALSLCASLQHICVRGNPVMMVVPGGGRPWLRNLCPTLMRIDDARLAPSRFSEALQGDRCAKRQPHGINRRPHTNAAQAGRTSSNTTTTTNTSSSCTQQEAAEDSMHQPHAMNLLHMLTQGVGGSSGYGAAHAAQQQQQRRQQQQQQPRSSVEVARRPRTSRGGGAVMREEALMRLAEASKNYLETTLVRRCVGLHPPPPSSSSCCEDAVKCANTTSPQRRRTHNSASRSELHDSPIPDVMGYSTNNTSRSRDDEERILRRYALSARGRAKLANTNQLRPRANTSNVGQQHEEEEMIHRRAEGVAATQRIIHSISPTRTPFTKRSASPYASHDDVGADDAQIDSYAAAYDPRRRSEEAMLGHRDPNFLPDPSTHNNFMKHTPIATTSSAEEPKTKSSTKMIMSGTRGAATHVVAQQEAYIIRGSSPSPRVERELLPADDDDDDDDGGVAGAHSVIHRVEGSEERVRRWVRQLAKDGDALQAALRTLVQLLDAQRRPSTPTSIPSQLPATYLHERRKCADIINGSGMLDDTHVPVEVLHFYELNVAHLQNLEGSARRGEVEDDVDAVERTNAVAHEQAKVSRLIRLVGDAKTCLRYVLLLMHEGREQPLQEYVSQVKESLGWIATDVPA